MDTRSVLWLISLGFAVAAIGVALTGFGVTLYRGNFRQWKPTRADRLVTLRTLGWTNFLLGVGFVTATVRALDLGDRVFYGAGAIVFLSMSMAVQETHRRLQTKAEEKQDQWLSENQQWVNAKIRRGLEQLKRGEGIPEDKLDAHLAKLKSTPE